MKGFARIICLILTLTLLLGCDTPAKTENKDKDNETKAAKLLTDKGYNIVSNDGEVGEYVLKKKLLLKLPYQQYWGVQSIDASDYIDKTIETYKFIISNHPLDNYKDNINKQTRAWVMVCEGKAIGGYTLPDLDLTGGVYSLEGKTIEEVSGLGFQEWTKKWSEKYK